MSSGTATSGGYMRQRQSYDCASSGDDLEDDARSIPQSQSPMFPTAKTRVEVLENVLWIVSAVFIVYFGDCHSNLIYLLFHDTRIRRAQMYVGLFGVSLNVIYFLYTSMSAWSTGESSEKRALSTTYALPLVTILALFSFCLFCFALWPIWSFLTLPLVFTLFMASMVILLYAVPETFMQQPFETFRID
ncbi:uncharacterized protein [Rutidosis leptorrhynchoides]|uniref:uncharacterized protein n=1 Tax=Rutidosis leptorrhynchoides TaxID=125765 RepID=UPI003A9951BB